MEPDLLDLGERVRRAFEDVHRRVFLGDPAANPHLKVEVVGPALAGDTPVVVLVTPWTLNGLAFPPDGVLPETLVVNARRLPVFANTVEGVGAYRSVNLMGDVSALHGPDQAREAAAALAGPFREAVEKARGSRPLSDPGTPPRARPIPGAP